MKQEIIADLSRITEEEQAILDGKTEVEKERYSSGQKFVMDAGKLLERGKLIDIRPHTRFIRFPAHSHNYVEMIYMCQGSTVHTINGERIELKTGELLILGCVVCWVLYTLIGRWMLTGVDALSTTAVTSTIGAAMLLAASLIVEGPGSLGLAWHSGGTAWGALLFLAFGATALAYAWYFDGVKALGAGAASGYITLVPLFGVLISALLLGETIDAPMLVGGAMAIAGTAVMTWGRR